MKKYLEIYPKTWKNHGNIMEFCQTEKVGTLYNQQIEWITSPVDRV